MGFVNRLLQFTFALFIGLIVLLIIFYFPFAVAYIKYSWARRENVEVIRKGSINSGMRHTMEAKDQNFGLIIPKLGINTSVTPNTNPFETYNYREIFTKGVAHSKGSSFPGKGGNIVIFSNFPGNFLEVHKYNLAFYMLNKLQAGDPVYIFYKDMLYTYSVTGKNVADVANVNFTSTVINPKTEFLTIMTLWPPGTSFRRLVVEAKKI